jgi:hypothetical protein
MSSFGNTGYGIIPPTRRWDADSLPRTGATRAIVSQGHAAAKGLFAKSNFAITSADYGMMPAANQRASVTGGLSGLGSLGLVNVSICQSYEDAVDVLGEAVKRGEEQGLTSDNFLQAKAKWEQETSYNVFGRTPVGKLLGNCESQTALIGLHIANVNKELGANSVSVPPNVQAQVNDATDRTKPPEEMSATAKFAIIGGITVVGIIGLAFITGQIAPLLRVVKKVV